MVIENSKGFGQQYFTPKPVSNKIGDGYKTKNQNVDLSGYFGNQ